MNTMKNKSFSILFRSAFFYLPLSLSALSCSNSEFGGGPKLSAQQDGAGSGGKKGDGKDPTVNKSGIGDDEDGDKNRDPDDPNDPNNPGNGDINGDGDRAKIADTTLEGLISCLKKKPSNYNIVLVLDNSGSQDTTDREKVRRAVSLDFVTRFNKLVSRKPDTVVQIGLVSFTTKATSFGWVRLDGKDDPASSSKPIDTLRTSIESATDAPAGGTFYGPAFGAAANLLRALGSPRFDPITKNYVLFMTDGDPNSGDTYTVPDVSATIVDENKAAILSIASGKGIKRDKEPIVQALALPQSGTHKGAYYREERPSAI